MLPNYVRRGHRRATLSAYERGLKSPTLRVVERIIEAAGYELALVTKVKFAHHTSPGVYPFWVPDRLWRGKLLHRGQPEEMIDWIDGALFVDLWDELKVPLVIRHAWDPVVELAGHGNIERPWYGLPAP